MAWIEPVLLSGKHVELVPLDRSYKDDLIEAVKDGDLWRLWYTFVPEPSKVAQEIERRLQLQAKESMVPFVVINPENGKAVGMTTYMNVDSVNRRVEIGSTWYARSVQRGPLNTECKLLMLEHAFKVLDCIAVEFRTSFFNHQSREAIERLGAKLDGILRNHMIASNGTLRDTCVYSILNSEWPAVKAHLQFELTRPR